MKRTVPPFEDGTTLEALEFLTKRYTYPELITVAWLFLRRRKKLMAKHYAEKNRGGK